MRRTPVFKKVSNQVNFVHLEHQVHERWKDSDVFGALRRQIAGGEPWSFIDGPITANNPMGVHHAWGRTYKDAFHRYFAMNGRDLRYQPGFDCQGLWVELEVQKELGLATKPEIEAYGLDRFTEACKARVEKYAAIQAQQSDRLGWWMDWDDAYYTMSETNNYSIWRFLKECHERGFLYKGTDVMPWSGQAGTAYSDMEVKEGRRLTVHRAIFARFPIRERDSEYLLVWTTTPWTLTSNVGVAVNVDLVYAKVRSKRDGALYYVAQENLNVARLKSEFADGFAPFGPWPKGVPKLKSLDQIFKETGGYEVEGTVTGAELVGLTYDGPFDDLPAQQRKGGFADPLDILEKGEEDWPAARDAHRVIDAGKDGRGQPYVTAGEGTGLVHTAPGCGDVDHVWGREHGLVSIAPLNTRGVFVEGFGKFTGLDPTDPAAVDTIVDALKESGCFFAEEKYPHVYPHCWRTGDELVYRLVDEWYISMEWRRDIMDVAEKVSWIPDQMKGKERELNWLETMRDWMISKKRYWGLALPIWECTACDHFEVIGGREELEARAVSGWETFDGEGQTPHRPYVDAIEIECSKCGARAQRVGDVGNPWLDAGIVAYSTTRFFEDREYWKKWVPADLITECFPGQFRNWFYALLSMSTMMETVRTDESGDDRRLPFQTLLGHALVMNEEGAEMHKSDGTAIWFEEAAEQIGVDTMRWMYCAQSPTQNLKFGTRHPDDHVVVERANGETISETLAGTPFCKVTSTPADQTRRKVLLPLWNSFAFFCNYARLDGFVPGKDVVPVHERPILDRWLLSELHSLIGTVRASYEGYRLDEVCAAIERFLDGMSRWYIRRSRRRFWRGADATAEERRESAAAYETLYEALTTVVRLAAPVVPFLADSIYRDLVVAIDADAPGSVHLTSFPVADPTRVDQSLIHDMAVTMDAVSLGRAIRSREKVGTRQPLRKAVILPAAPGDADALESLQSHIIEELNVKEVHIERDPAFVSWTFKPQFPVVGPRLGANVKKLVPALMKLDESATLRALRETGRITVELDGEPMEFTTDEIQVVPSVDTDQAVAFEGGAVVLLDLEIDEALEGEGLAREVVRKLQDQRKVLDFEMEDRVDLVLFTADEQLRGVLAEHRATIAEELLATSFDMVGSAAGGMHSIAVKADKALEFSMTKTVAP